MGDTLHCGGHHGDVVVLVVVVVVAAAACVPTLLAPHDHFAAYKQ